MATNKTSKTSKTSSKPVVAKPAGDGRHTRENVICDSVMSEMIARGSKTSVEQIAKATGSAETMPPIVTAAAKRLALLAEASKNPQLALDAGRILRHAKYASAMCGALTADGWEHRNNRDKAVAEATAKAYAAAVKAAGRKKS